MRNPINTSQTRVLSSSSSSSSRSYSPSSSSSSSVLPHTTRTMEQVWKDLNLFSPPPPISLHNPNPSSNPDSSFRSVILQDFLAAGPCKDSSSAAASHQMPCVLHNEEQFGALPPQIALSLNSSALDHFDQYDHHHQFRNNISSSRCAGHEHDQNGRGDHHDHIDHPPFVPPPVANFSDAGAVGLFSFCPNKRAMLESSCSDGGDRRHTRMMKNRESAARSRARKQAYTNELELEVAHLVAENEKLKKQYEELSLTMAAQHSAKKTLQRTLTAPF